jgi:hypothetical protein
MPARKLLTATVLALFICGVTADTASAQFTPRFSTREATTPVQWHVGIGATVANMGDYTSGNWPQLESPTPILHARVGVAIPISGEKLFLVPEIELNTAGTEGEYVHPIALNRYLIPEVGQRGFSIMLNLVRAVNERNVLMGAGLGYHLVEHDPVIIQAQITESVPFHKDPFNHIGIGFQAHYARYLAQLSDKVKLMLEGRYKAAFLSGNVSDRTLLMSEFQVSFYLAIK